ncbi:MAG TPA: SRPBCC family protein [Gemmatimonadales bacterium]|nr:SRPBCC family protein [Gemmatimonadales bacterium]
MMMARTQKRRKAVVTLPSDTQILITRDFDAPRNLVWRAWTTPDLIKRWWHANRGTATEAKVDLRAGGRWRWVMITHQGLEVAFHGEYREVVPDERLVYTEVYEGVPNGDDFPVVVTLTLAERQGRTRITELVQCPSREVRDMIIQSGMEDGMQDAMDLLEGVARSLRA